MNTVRLVRFRPYLSGAIFTLRLYECQIFPSQGLRYRLTMRENGRTTVLFDAGDFKPGAGMAEDGDDAVRSLMSFLTLRPGDTDAEYFENYTETQRAYCDAHAESLAMAVIDRFGEG